jgi:hypothetical protein
MVPSGFLRDAGLAVVPGLVAAETGQLAQVQWTAAHTTVIADTATAALA